MQKRTFKVTVCFEVRPSGRLRAYSKDVPGLAVSNMHLDRILEDVSDALSIILSARLDAAVEIEPLGDVRDALESNGRVVPQPFVPGPKDYVAILPVA
jgi:hypothetical protein